MKKPAYICFLALLCLTCSSWKLGSSRDLLLDELFSTSPHDQSVSRTSGVAPLAVHFFADFVHSADGDEKIRRFHHYDYTWDFGDGGCGGWSTTGKPCNTAKGAAAVHVFEEPGEYTILLTIRDQTGEIGTESHTVSVADPEEVYGGTNTICVNNEGDSDFSHAPPGALTVSTNDLSTVTGYATAGSRILFKRGSAWTTAGLAWPDNGGPVTIGAYGPGTRDAQGIYDNAPRITVTGGYFLGLSFKQDWRFMDLHLVDATGNNDSFSGATDMQRQLFFRLKIEGFSTGLGWSHWNEANLMRINDMVIASCNVSGSSSNIMYVGAERLALLGNILEDAQISHVLRVWQAYRSVIGHNIISGSSVNTAMGRHALKLHGPGVRPGDMEGGSLGVPVPHTGRMDVKTQFCIVADNIFGTSGPWPVAIGPQDSWADERLTNIIFERNRIHSDYGTPSVIPVQVALHVWAQYCTVRNNIFDGTGSGSGYYAIALNRRGIEPAPRYIEIYNNTIYRGDAASGSHRGIVLQSEVRNAIAGNNLVSFPYASGPVMLMEDLSPDLTHSNNLITTDALFIRPDDGDPLNRDFSPGAGSPAIDAGAGLPLYDDFLMRLRTGSPPDLGAMEY